MNSVSLVGRLTRDPEVRYTSSNMAVARFSIAIDRRRGKDGEEQGADFPSIVVFGKQGENCGAYLSKGSQVAITGRIQTGSYTKQDGTKVYTTDVVADRVEFLGGKKDQEPELHGSPTMPANLQDYPSMEQQERQAAMEIPEGFHALDDEDSIPF